ncbi:MAG: c-type cytochrome domain-containing protein [Bacteroidales bacterium]|nr:c-type cytochrome domain-containing protein [Bacteroidales bacterium]
MKNKSGNSILPALLIFSLFYFYSCKHDPELSGIIIPVDTTGNNNGGTTESTCNKDTVYFVQAVLPMFQSSCALSGCHDAITHKEGLRLDSYSGIISGGINGSNPTNSKIYRVMVSSGEEQMPPSPVASMTSTQLSTISKWISQGAKNNSCIESGCDTTNVKYSTHIKPLIQTNCQGCHSGATPGGGINLATYAGVKAIADNGKFFGSISQLSGYKTMPQNGNKLTDCQITTVKIWINQGSPEN